MSATSEELDETDVRTPSRSPERMRGPIAVDAESPNVRLDKDQRRKLMRNTAHFREKTTAELEATFTLREEGIRIGYDKNEDLLNVYIAPKIEDAPVDPDGWRVIVHDIFVENFKSYKGRQQLGPLHKNLTMIVGPNGSGKSNVIDALLFVFGFKAKKIRSPKLTALINDKGDCDEARVEVHFLEIMDLGEEKYKISSRPPLVIARTINKKDQSFYYINDMLSSASLVITQLQTLGIDLSHNRFLILQGEVESIAQMPPTSKDPNVDGMLEYIEDIVGTYRFKEPIEKLKHRLKLYEVKSSSVQANVRENKQTKKGFEAPMFHAMQFLNVANNIVYVKAFIAQCHLKECRDSRDQLERRMQDARDRLDEKKAESKEAHKAFTQKEKEEKTLEMAHRDKTKEKIKIDGENDKLRMKREKVKKREEAAKAEHAKITKEIEAIYKELQLAFDIPGQANLRTSNLRVEVEQLKAEKVEFDRLEQLNRDKYEIKAKADKEKIVEEEKKLAEAGEQFRISLAQIQDLEMDLEQKKSDVLIPGQMENNLQLIQTNQQLFIETEKQLTSVIFPQLTAIRAEIATGERKIAKIRTHYDELVQRKQAAKSELSYVAFIDSDGKSLTTLHKRLLDLEKKGELHNFVGRMGDLASIHQKFDAAMSTCFGGILDLFVMKTGEDSVAAIDLLTRYRYGRGNFFGLDRLEPALDRYMNKPASDFPAPRLFDQITFTDMLTKRSYYHFMRDMLVCKNIDEAKRLDQKHKGEYRYCTLDGTTVDQSGNMTGGGTPATGAMNVTGTEKKFNNDIEKKAHIYKMKTRMEQAQREMLSVEQYLADENAKLEEAKVKEVQLKEQETNLEIEFNRLRSEIDYLADRNSLNEHRLKQIESIGVIKAAIRDIEQRLPILVAENKAQGKQRDEAQAAAKSLRKKIDRMYSDMVTKNLEGKLKAESRLKELSVEVAKEEAIISANPAKINAIKARLNDAEKRLAKKKEEVDGFAVDDRDDIVSQQAEMLTQLTELERECTEMQAQLDALRAERKELETKLKEANRHLQEAEAYFKKAQGEFDMNDEETDLYTNKIAELEGQFRQPEDLDPDCKYVRESDPDFNERINNGALVMPQEVLDMFDDYTRMYERQTTALYDPRFAEEIGTKQNIANYRAHLQQLEAQYESYRSRHDHKAVSQYCSCVSLQMDEERRERGYNAMLDAHRKKLTQLKNERFAEFMEALMFLGSTTQMLYQMITNGGDASLKFMEEGRSSDPFEGGIGFNVRPAQKSWKEIKNLSGGEKTLASLCFVFAMHHFRATPLYVMDEIDAALDQVNVRLIANYIKFSEKTAKAQFMIISLRNQMFELGPRLIGIYKVDGITRNVVINPDTVVHNNRWGNELLEKKRKDAYRRAKAIQTSDFAHEFNGMSLGPRRLKRRLGIVRLNDFLNSDPESDGEEEPPKRVIGYGTVPRLPGAPAEDEIPIKDDEPGPAPKPKQRSQSGPPAKRRTIPVINLPSYAVVHERSPSEHLADLSMEDREERRMPHEDELSPISSPNAEEMIRQTRARRAAEIRRMTESDDEEEKEAEVASENNDAPEDNESVGSYNDFEEEGDEPIRKKNKRKGDVDDDDIDDATPTQQSPESSKAPSARQSRSPSQSPRHTAPAAATPSTSTGRASRSRAARK